MADQTEIQFEPSWIKFGASGSEAELGFTEGPITLTFTEESGDIVADQTGKTVLDDVLLGEAVTAKFSLKQWSLDNLKVAFPHAATAVSGIAGGRLPGAKGTAVSGVLIVHPTRKAATATDEDFRILRAKIKVDGDIEFKHDGSKLLPCVAKGFLDYSKASDGDGLWEYGTWT